MSRRIIFIFCFLLMIQTILLFPVFGQKGKDLDIIQEPNKIALVMGNSSYQNGFRKLNSPRNDATKMAAALKRLGFRLIGDQAQIDLTFDQMEKLLDQFTNEIKHGGVGFFYFSGHGSQDNNKNNYLIPIDTQIDYQSDLKTRALNVETITSRMEETENRLNILVLDACRNNPLPSGFKSGNKGLNTSVEIPNGVYIAFAARDGQTALDGETSGLSLYTEHLLRNLETPNERLEDIFIKTRVGVKQETGSRQFPIDYGSIDGIFYFNLEGQDSAENNRQTSSDISSDGIKEAENFYNAGLKCNSRDYNCQISNYTKAINLNPGDFYSYLNRASAYESGQEYDLAIEDYTRAISLRPKFAIAYNNRGSDRLSKKEYVQAIEDFTKAISLEPNDAMYYRNRSIAYDLNAEKNKAEEDKIKADNLEKKP